MQVIIILRLLRLLMLFLIVLIEGRPPAFGFLSDIHDAAEDYFGGVIERIGYKGFKFFVNFVGYFDVFHHFTP